MQIDRSRIREGMTVYSSDGEKLGKVQQCDPSSFIIEKGFFFPKDYLARFEDVASVDGDEIRLSMPRDSFERLRETGEQATTEGYSSSRDIGDTGYGMPAGTGASRMSATGEEVRIPVAEEELDVVKRERQTGEVRLEKDVVTETRHIDVPVTREEVHVERVAATDRTPTGDEKLFQKESVSVPVHEEELEIHKRPVVKEEVRLRKDQRTEQRAAEADVRKERIDIEGDEGTRRIDAETDELGRPRRMRDPDEDL